MSNRLEGLFPNDAPVENSSVEERQIDGGREVRQKNPPSLIGKIVKVELTAIYAIHDGHVLGDNESLDSFLDSVRKSFQSQNSTALHMTSSYAPLSPGNLAMACIEIEQKSKVIDSKIRKQTGGDK